MPNNSNDQSKLSDNSNPPTSTNLIIDLINNEEKAWNQFVSIYKHFIIKRIEKMNKNPSDRDDIMQEVLVRLLKAFPLYNLAQKQNPGSFRAWLKTIVNSSMIDLFVENGKMPLAMEDEPLSQQEFMDKPLNSSDSFASYGSEDTTTRTSTIDEQAFLSWRKEFFENILNLIQEEVCIQNTDSQPELRISPRDLAVVYYRRAMKRTDSEVAEEMGLTPGNVRQITRRVEQRMMQLLPVYKASFEAEKLRKAREKEDLDKGSETENE